MPYWWKGCELDLPFVSRERYHVPIIRLPSGFSFCTLRVVDPTFFSAASEVAPSVLGLGDTSSSAKMVSSFDSRPVRNEPHLDVLGAADGGAAISRPTFELRVSLPI